MNFLAALSLLTFMIYVFIGIYTFKTINDSIETRLFLMLCFSLSIWSFGYMFAYTDLFNPEPLMKVAAVGWCTFNTFVLHIALKFTNNKLFKNIYLQGLIYLPSIFLIYVRIFLHWESIDSSMLIYNIFTTVDTMNNIIYQFSSLILIALWGRQQSDSSKKRQAMIIICTSAASFALNFLAQVRLLPTLGQFYALIMILGIYYSIVRHNLFKIPSDILFDEILTEMMDLFFLISPDSKVIKVNKRTAEVLGYSQNKLLNMKIEDLFVEKDIINKTIQDAYASGRHIYDEVSCISMSGEKTPISISCLSILDKSRKSLISTVIIGQDITITKELENELRIHEEIEEKLRISEEKFRVMFSEHSAIMLLIDPENLRIYSANNSAQKFYGFSEEKFKNMKINELNEMNDSEVNSNVSNILNKQISIMNSKHRLSNGEVRNVEIHPAPINVGDKVMIFSIIHDITERKKAEDYITYLAYHDALTGLVNRKYFVERLEKELLVRSDKNQKLAIIYCDLNGFKSINDTFGHEAGDYVLCEIGNRIKKCISKEDVVARLGGDEFAIIIFNINNDSEVNKVIQKISNKVQVPMFMKDNVFNVKASMGISIFPHDGESVDDLLSKADKAMYLVKKNSYRYLSS